jgi:hypothetical protein
VIVLKYYEEKIIRKKDEKIKALEREADVLRSRCRNLAETNSKLNEIIRIFTDICERK